MVAGKVEGCSARRLQVLCHRTPRGGGSGEPVEEHPVGGSEVEPEVFQGGHVEVIAAGSQVVYGRLYSTGRSRRVE
jgi:hypothetical protein